MPAFHPRPLFRRHVLGMAGGLLLVAASVAAELVTYPEYPEAIRRDWAYEVSVTQGSDTWSIPVYNHSVKSPLTGRTRGGDGYRRFCEFAFSGEPVRVDIRVCEDVQSYKVFPARLGLESSFSNGVISVWLATPHSFGIELNDYVKTILSVIVDKPENPADIPSRDDPDVLYIDGWVDPPGPDGLLTITNQCSEVYIAPGAVLNSRLYVKKQGVHVHGRGMILDPFSDIFRYDQLNNTEYGVVRVSGADVLMEDVKIVDARTFNYVVYANNATLRNVKAFSAMMCSDGLTLGGRNIAVEGAWLYVGDNALVVSGMSQDGRFSDVTIGTSCNAVFPQGNNIGVTMEDIDVFRCDEGLISNIYNPGTSELGQSFFFKNLSAVDATLFSRFFLGANMGTLRKTFAFENLAIPNSTGSVDWHTIGNSGGKTIRVSDDEGKPWTTGNYELTITNLWVNGARSDGFAASEFSNPTGVTVTVVNTVATPPIPAVPNRHVVNWTCPWKFYIGDSLQRDVRFAIPEAGEQRLVETNVCANLLDDPPAPLSAWQRSPSWTGKLDATRVEDGARIYRIRPRETQYGMYNEITDAFLRRGNGVYHLSFDARVVDGPDVPLDAILLSDEDRLTMGFTIPSDGAWHGFEADFKTGFDPAVTELVGLTLRSAPGGVIVDFRNLSFTKVREEPDPEGWKNCRFAYEIEMSFPGIAPVDDTLTEFPVLVRLSENIPDFRYSDFQLPRGGDLRFFDSNGDLIPHEIDTWDENGESLVWVRVPSLDARTWITARYGCGDEPPAFAPKKVWSNGYVGVWHLGEGNLPLKESSWVTTDFTTSVGTGTVFASPGAVGGAVDFGESGNSRKLVAQDHYRLDGFTQCTIEAWTYLHSQWRNSPAGNKGLLGKRNAYFYKVSYYLHDSGSGTTFVLSTTGSDRLEAPAATCVHPNADVWTHQAYTFNAGAVSGYRNGVPTGTGTVDAEKMYSGDTPLVLGSFDTNEPRNYPGKVDELRISEVARSAGWMRATYETVMNANFATYAVRPYKPIAASDSEGYDWTNRVVTVTGARSGETLTLALSTPDGMALGTATATADAEGTATFDIATEAGRNYAYAIRSDAETLVAGSFQTGGWDADAWFLAAPDGQGGSLEVNCAWLSPPMETNEAAYVVDGTSALALADDAVAEGSNGLVRVEADIVFRWFLRDVCDFPEAVESSEAIAQIGPMTNTVAGGPSKWVAHVGGAWTELSGAIQPAINIPYVVRFEGDFSLDIPRVRFSVSDDDGATFSTLSDASTGSEWLVPTADTRHALSEIMTAGETRIAGIRGTLSNADVASADGTGYASLADALASGEPVTLLTNTTWPTNAPAGTVTVNRDGYSILLPPDGVAVDGNTVTVSAGLCTIAGEGTLHVTLADLSAIGIATAGRTSAQIAADLLENGANGIPKWQSYVLGLDATVATALPYANIATGTVEDTVEVSLGGVEVNVSAGATVTYRVYEVENLADFPDGGTESEATAPDEKVSASTSDAYTKFFRLKVFIDVP